MVSEEAEAKEPEDQIDLLLVNHIQEAKVEAGDDVEQPGGHGEHLTFNDWDRKTGHLVVDRHLRQALGLPVGSFYRHGSIDLTPIYHPHNMFVNQ